MTTIPKKIHYCWFGGNPLTELGERCLESWKKYFPDYEIIEWNESNYDVNKIPYIKDAYEAKKYAFVTYTTATEGMVAAAKEALTTAGFETIYETTAGATITSHCGEDTLGILFLNK